MGVFQSSCKGDGGGRGKGELSITDADRAILDLKNARDRLRRFQRKLEGESVALTERAAALVRAGRRDRALLLLRMRRSRAERCAQADGQLAAVSFVGQFGRGSARSSRGTGRSLARSSARRCARPRVGPGRRRRREDDDQRPPSPTFDRRARARRYDIRSLFRVRSRVGGGSARQVEELVTALE